MNTATSMEHMTLLKQSRAELRRLRTLLNVYRSLGGAAHNAWQALCVIEDESETRPRLAWIKIEDRIRDHSYTLAIAHKELESFIAAAKARRHEADFIGEFIERE